MNIPGLSHTPASGAALGLEDMQLMSFNMTTFTVPAAHIYGHCRPVTEYTRMRKIGTSINGPVYLVTDNKTNDICALKKLDPPKESEPMPQEHVREITNLKLLKHLNIVNLHDMAVGKSIDSTYLAMDFCDYSLSRVIDQVSKSYLTLRVIKNIMSQLLNGLDFIHKKCVMHRHLSPSHILFTEAGVLKIGEFGSSRKEATGDLTPGVGSRWYKSPEILFGERQYTSAVDMWAAGCIFGELVGKRVLFRGKNDGEIIKKMIKLLGTPTERTWPGFDSLPGPSFYHLKNQPYSTLRSCFSHESPTVVELMKNLLTYYPPSRFTAEQCLQHLYFEEYPSACSSDDLYQVLRKSARL